MSIAERVLQRAKIKENYKDSNQLEFNAPENYSGELQIKLTGDAVNTILEMMSYIQMICNSGHGFDILVGAGESEYERKFFIDGDGSDQVFVKYKDTKADKFKDIGKRFK